MTKNIDGFVLDIPLVETQVIALAQYHHKKIDDAIFHQEIHLGEFGLQQKFKVDEFVKTLSEADRHDFYEIYSAELERLARTDDHLRDEHESGNLGVILIVLVIIAVAIYYFFARPLMG
jgi:hypothetical protein